MSLIDVTRNKNLIYTLIAIVAGILCWFIFGRESTEDVKEEKAPTAISITYEAIEKDWSLIAKLSQLGILYLVCFAETDEAEASIRDSLKEVVDSCIPEHHVLFYGTEGGRVSVVRQLQTTVHIDHDPEVITSLEGKVPHIAVRESDIERQVLKAIAESSVA